MSDDPVTFLRARLDEDKARAAAAAEDAGARWYYGGGYVLARREDDMVATGSHDFLDQERGEFIAAHDPARVLAEVEAKQQLLDEHEADSFGDCTTCARPEDFDEDGDGNRTWSRSSQPFPCPTLRLLSLPYADHPDYREEWRP